MRLWCAVGALGVLAACASDPKPLAVKPAPPAPIAVSASAHFPNPYVETLRTPLQCVPYARRESGIEIQGNANLWWDKAAGVYRRGSTPSAGSVMVLEGYRTTRRGHVAVVRAQPNARTLIIDHANWLGKGEIDKSIPVRDTSANNDWSRVQVWHVPTGTWGTRVYKVEGFIYPERLIASN